MSHKPRKPKVQSGFSEEGQSTYKPSMQQTVELGAGGRLVIPAPMREALGMKSGDRLNVRLEGRELRIYSLAEGLRRARAIVRKFVPEGVSLVDELIADRRREAERERKDAENG